MHFKEQLPLPPQESNLNKRDEHLNPSEGIDIARNLLFILDKYKDKRVLVIAPPCSGKSTILQHLQNGVDLDTVFDTMPEDFKRHILHHENPFMFLDGDKQTVKYTEKIFVPDNRESEDFLRSTTKLLTDYMNTNLKIVEGNPVFGTSIIDTDVVIYLKLSDEVLDSRLESRNTKTHRLSQRDRVYAIRKLIEEEVADAKNKWLTVEVFEIN